MESAQVESSVSKLAAMYISEEADSDDWVRLTISTMATDKLQRSMYAQIMPTNAVNANE